MLVCPTNFVVQVAISAKEARIAQDVLQPEAGLLPSDGGGGFLLVGQKDLRSRLLHVPN